MRALITILCLLSVISFGVPGNSSQTAQTNKQIIIAAGAVFDGKGGVLRNTRIVVEGSKIVRIDPNAAPVNYDLRGLTVLPGWIDSHVHITWSFGPDGKNAGAGGTTRRECVDDTHGWFHDCAERRLAKRSAFA
jgi:hypothetical protein